MTALELWEREAAVDCVVCPQCAFTFDADHEDAQGGYSCPVCQVEVAREALERIAEDDAFARTAAEIALVQIAKAGADELLERWTADRDGLVGQREELLQIIREALPYVQVEASLQNSGLGRVVGNPARPLLTRMQEVLR